MSKKIEVEVSDEDYQKLKDGQNVAILVEGNEVK